MKKLLFVFLMFVFACPGFARPGSDSDSPEAKQTNRFLTNGFSDNWFMTLAAGGQVYMGKWDAEGAFGQRITPALNLNAGKWVSPKVGFRIGVDGYELKGFSQKDGGFSTGIADNGIYKQQWNYFNFHADVLYNFSSVVAGYNPSRVYSCIPYIGIGWAHTFPIHNNSLTFNGGIINRFWINNALSLNLELKGMIVDTGFDNESNSVGIEGLGAVLFGVTYRFKNGTFERYKEVTPVNVCQYTNEIDQLKDQLNAEQRRSQQLSGLLEQQKETPPQEIKEVITEIAPLALFFEIGSAQLSKKDILNLSYMAEVIRKTPDKVFEITGYADRTTGSAKRNRELKKQRAVNVHDTLVDLYGITPQRLRVILPDDNLSLAEDPTLNRAVVIR